MLKRIIPLIIVGVLCVTFTVAPALALLPVGQTAPDFQLSDLTGNVHTLSDYRGKVVVFDFFEPYCGYCQQDTRDNLIPLYNTYYKDNANVQFFSIETSGASVSEIQSIYLAATGSIPWPILTNGGNVASTYGIGVTPTVYVVDPAGKIAVAMPYPIDVATLKSTIDELAATKQSTTLTATASTATPAVNQTFTINGALKAGTTPIAGVTIQLQKNVSGTWTNVAGKTNKTRSDGTYNIITREPTAATYQYRTTYAGDASYTSATSNVVNVKVQAGAGEWGTWGSLGGQLTASPAAVSWADGRIDVFGRGSDNALWWRHYDSGTWSAWESLGGQLAATTGPAVSSQAEGQLDVFAIGSDNAIWTRYYDGSAWSSWESLSGQFTASPASVSWADGRVDLFGHGSDNALWHRYYDGSAWSSWESLSGQLAATTGAAVSSQAAGQLDVFAVGSDNALWHRSYNSGAWSTWGSLSGQFTASPAAVSWVNGRIDLFGHGSDNALWWRNYSNSAWSSWKSLSGQLASTTGPAVSSQREGQLDVFVIGSDNALWHRTYA